ncbi:FAD-dependent oxidoreductase [Amnibacterium kyonggiense]|uniref:Glycine/D-amino acid oxidase-like deaminating enzyme n=1 Tax=Amnibacterium kyonggiense TaxID=595671 RepID=A0A4R7FDC5_9MICO|nr:FAD-dependent oxidoreductase [Amnibacterium kyonggiense]TDS74959.1 glycine/D-amino acid oxidase-like deaminating enzyme [Amnibacterium kyonggiense]
MSYDAIVIGGGFYGLRVAMHLRERCGSRSVLVLEAAQELMGRASYTNQARVHNGYHYPRSLLTGYRSQVNFPRFVEEYRDAVVSDFPHYYGIARTLSKTSARQFELFCRRIGSKVGPAPAAISSLFDSSRIEELFLVQEPAFDSRILRRLLLERIECIGGIDIEVGVRVERVEGRHGTIEVHAPGITFRAPRVVSALYSGTNVLLEASDLPVIGLQHELTELALVELPDELEGAAFTVMDGPFFSLMPFPSRGLHSLSHVRYTPHHRWSERAAGETRDPYDLIRRLQGHSRFSSMKADVVRYFPGARRMEHRDSLYEAKTVLARSSGDDSRPILYRPDHGIPGYTCVMGGKLDNIYDVLLELEHQHAA